MQVVKYAGMYACIAIGYCFTVRNNGRASNILISMGIIHCDNFNTIYASKYGKPTLNIHTRNSLLHFYKYVQ